MRKVSFGIACFISIAVLVILSTDSGAFQGFDNGGGAGVPACAACHSDLANFGPDHGAHAALSNNDCNSCHVGGAGNNNPPLANCVRCHGRDADGNPSADFSAGLGRGLRQHHVTVGVAACGNCHDDTVNANTGSAPENVLPSFYPQALGGAGLDPCDGSEEQFPSNSVSLDNDGDGFTDGADSDCQAAAPQIGVAPALKAYGDVTVAGSSSQAFTISNTGSADLVVSGMTLTDTTNFSLDTAGGPNGCGSVTPTIVAGDNCTVAVAFSPQSAAAFSGTFSVTSNDGTNPTVDVALSGNGVATATPNIAVAPASVDFGEVNVGDSPATEVTISNTGTADLVVSNIALDNAAVYSLDLNGGANPCGSATPTIVAGDNCTVDAVFAPVDDGGPFNATVTVDSDDPDTPSVDVPLTGTGFLDTDGDGVGDSVDDFPIDPSKATPQSATGTGKITVDAGTNALSMVAAVAEGDVDQTGKPSGFTFPDGLVTFQVAVPGAGDNAVVTLTFPSGQPSGGKYYKVGPGGFAEFAGATINTDNVVLMLTDGGSGDNDNTADAVITDPGGLATPVPSSSGGGGGGCSVIGAGGNWGGGAVLFLTLLAILVTLRRKGARARR